MADARTETSPERGPSATLVPRLAMIGITKRFPGVLANSDIDLVIRAGEIHVLLGENGAGKSTLVALLSGLLQPDAGRIEIDGQVRRLDSPARALALGIGTVFQHGMLAPSLTVAETIALGGPWWRPSNRAAMARKIQAMNADLGLAIDPGAVTGRLSLGEQQQVEIMRALLRGSRVLILDESTSMLTPRGAEDLGALMRRLAERGIALVFITHKLHEAFAYANRISVLRLGRKVGEIGPERLAALDEAALSADVLRLMFGTATTAAGRGDAPLRRRSTANGAAGRDPVPLFEVADLTLASPGASQEGLDLQVAAGEILGIAGIDGNGQTPLAEALAGQRPIARGVVAIGGEPIQSLDVGGRRKRGLRYVTDDRLGEGTIGAFPVAVNLLLKEIGEAPFWTYGFERAGRIAEHARGLVQDFDIRTPSVETPIGRLSGGNIQKALLARELSGTARVVIYAKPTHGLDVRNIEATRRRIREAADRGIATILISTDLEELLDLCDRIAVMVRGRIVGTVSNDARARAAVGALMVGEAA